MILINQWVSQDVCLACRGCCRYAERDTVWAPMFLCEEIHRVVRNGRLPAVLFSHAQISVGGDGVRIQLEPSDGGFVCPALEPATNRCHIYDLRPFDCRLYPVLLVHQGQRAFVAYDQKCPYMADHHYGSDFDNFVMDLASNFLSQDVLGWLANHPSLIQKYTSDYKILFSLPVRV